jgi:hypothetical protein
MRLQWNTEDLIDYSAAWIDITYHVGRKLMRVVAVVKRSAAAIACSFSMRLLMVQMFSAGGGLVPEVF